ncbi:hemerythrin domain-containing protein [Nocardia africana]|uniref:Alr3199 protein n=1 Tax=Nocardia africana TaxID=134964 RepID=A0A378X0S9_9NOCA|nr:hemerythrin domain-containing protein [Nocardia africana]MCC3312402.1 hemerythrin domain-containing protein [Nocardia africana]SUA46284.1 Alr3199 protein [Nocardia africana]
MSADEADVVDLLVAQHRRIEDLLGTLRAGPDDKQNLFEELVRLLAVHETAEEEVVHPAAARAQFGAKPMVDNRLAEENQAKHDLAELYDLGVDHPEFDAKLSAFADAVLEHAEHEEKEEFVLLRQSFSGTQLTHMANTVRGAEAMAPTRPHPHAGESRAANLVAGPPLAVFDRARDALRNVRRPDTP